jgi:hypothetical protein
MKSLFEPADRASILERLNALQTSASRQWGKMNSAQMLAHCCAAIETSTGDRPMKQAFIGKLLAPFVRKSILGDKPFSRNSPTDPTFVIRDERDFGAERKRLIDLINRFAQRGPAETGKATHAFFGKISGDEWGQLMYKHIDHHLQQFGL